MKKNHALLSAVCLCPYRLGGEGWMKKFRTDGNLLA